jgi:hypothetical protein
MTAGSAADSGISEFLLAMEQELRRDDNLRRELSIAVRRKDESAIRRVAAGIWEGLKFVAPIAFSVLLGIFGIPGVVRTPLLRPPDKLDVVCRVHHPPDAIPNISSDGIRRCQYGVDSDHPHERGTEDDRFRTHEIRSLGSPYSNSGMAYSWLVPHIAGRNPHECLTRPCCSEEDEIWWSLWGKRVPLWAR